MTTTMTPAPTTPTPPGAARPKWTQDKRVWVGAAIAVLILALWHPWSHGGKTEQAAAQPIELSGPTTTGTSPRVDPMGNLGLLNPTAAAMIGTDFESRREAARRASDLMANYGASPCSLVIGSAPDGSWELSITWGLSHPVPLLASCPWPPAPGGVTSPTVTK